MKINNYKFGLIKIDEKVYRKDVIIFPDEVYSPWWRKKGHYLQLEDMDRVFQYNPAKIIIGTGASGVMRVADEVTEKIKNQGLEFEICRTGEAVKKFNKDMKKNKKTVACLHLTC